MACTRVTLTFSFLDIDTFKWHWTPWTALDIWNCLILILAWLPGVLTEVFCGFSQFIINFVRILALGHDDFFFPNPFQFVNHAVIWRFLVRSTESVTKYTNKWSFVFIVSYICYKKTCVVVVRAPLVNALNLSGCGYTLRHVRILHYLLHSVLPVGLLQSHTCPVLICLTSVLLLCSRQRTVLRDGRPSTRQHTPGSSKGYFFLRNGLLFSWYWRSFLKGKVAGAWSWPLPEYCAEFKKKICLFLSSIYMLLWLPQGQNYFILPPFCA
jgi:hypothetical protein